MALCRSCRRGLRYHPDVDQKSRQQEDRIQRDGRLSDEERRQLLELLERTRDQVLERAAGLSDEAWSNRPAPNRWTVAEIVEHLMLFEEGVFKLKKIDDALASDADPHWASVTAGREEVLLREASNRRQRIQAPEPFRPSGKLHRREVIERYTKARAKTIEFIRGTRLPIKAYTAESVGFGTMNVYQWVFYMALHNERHNQQIAEATARAVARERSTATPTCRPTRTCR